MRKNVFKNGYPFWGINCMVTIYKYCTSAWTIFWVFSYSISIFYYLMKKSTTKKW